MAKPPTDLKNRMRDEVRSIRPGTTREPEPQDDKAPKPDFADLDIPDEFVSIDVNGKATRMSLKRAVELQVAAHVEQGDIERKAAKVKDSVSAWLKLTIRGYVDCLSFTCRSNTVTLYEQTRDSFDHKRARIMLAGAGVRESVLAKVWDECHKVTTFDTLKVTPPKV